MSDDARNAPRELSAETLHSLSNQLAIIVGFVEMMLAEDPGDQRRSDLEEIRAAARTAARLIGRPMADK